LPMLKKKFLHFSEYAGKTIDQVLTTEQLQHAGVLTVNQDQSCVFINDGRGGFEMQPLPLMAQLAPVFGAIATDLNGDGLTDIFLAGNFYSLKPQAGRLDASFGTCLVAHGKGRFIYTPPAKSGLFVKGEARDIKLVPAANGTIYIAVAVNNEPLYFFERKKDLGNSRTH